MQATLNFHKSNKISFIVFCFISQKSLAGSLVSSTTFDLTPAGNDNTHAFEAAWSCCADDEQLAVLTSGGIQFFSGARNADSPPQITTAYSSMAWSPFLQRKSRTLLAARFNSVDVLDIITGSVVASYENIFGADSSSSGTYFLLIPYISGLFTLPKLLFTQKIFSQSNYISFFFLQCVFTTWIGSRMTASWLAIGLPLRSAAHSAL